MTPIQQLDSRYLLYGLNALSRAFASNYFEDGHRGGAMVSAYYLCKEAGVEDTVAPLLGAAIDERWATTDLCAAFPDEPAQPELVEKILDAMSAHMAGLRQAGHNVILPALALRALREIPQAVTATRVDGICQLIERFTVSDVPTSEDPVQLPEPTDAPVFPSLSCENLSTAPKDFMAADRGGPATCSLTQKRWSI